MRVAVVVKCVKCGDRREIQAGEIGVDDVPVCGRCGMPMVPVKAAATRTNRRTGR